MESKPILSRLGISPLVPREPTEPHRGATPLELLFDLVSVIAVASAAAGLHHAILAFHITEGVLKFADKFGIDRTMVVSPSVSHITDEELDAELAKL